MSSLRLRASVLSPTTPTRALYLSDAVVVVDGGRITSITPYSGQDAEDLRPGILLPGFVDGHLHYPQTRIVGSASGPLLTWLEQTTFPEEARFYDKEHATSVAECFAANLAASGTTLAMAYGSVHPDASEQLFRVLAERGLRAIAGPVLMDAHSPESLILPADRAIPALGQLAEQWHGHDDGRLQVAVVPRFALSCSTEMMRAAGELANSRGLRVTTHIGEHPDEVALAKARFGTSDYLKIYEDHGLVGEGSVFAHAIHLTDSEWSRFAEAGCVVAHCPDSNAFLGSGDMPTQTVLDRNIPIVLGTDVAAGRTFRVPRIASAAYDNALRRGHALHPLHLLWWATRGGALALGEARVGALEPGLDADMVLLDLPPWAETQEQILAAVFFDADSPRPRRTYVRGRLIWTRCAGGYPSLSASSEIA